MKIALLALMLVASPATNDFMIGIVAYHIPFESYKIGSEDIAKISGSGAGWIAVDFAWRDIESEKGSFDFSYYDAMVAEAGKKGIRIFARVGNGYNGVRSTVPEWSQSLSREEYNRYIERYASAVAERYGDGIDYYAIENEPNNFLIHVLSEWRTALLPEKEMLSTMRAIARGVLKGDESAIMALSISLSPGYLEWIDRAKGYVDFDLIALNAYKSPAVLGREIERLRAMGYRVVVLETGLSTFYRSEEEQAEFVKNAMIASYNAGAEGVFVYTYKDNEEETNAKERSFGLIRSDGTEKQAFKELTAVREIIENGEVNRIHESESMKDRLSILLLESKSASILINIYLYIIASLFLSFQPFQRLYNHLMDYQSISKLVNSLNLAGI
ncbi:MAG: beta-galactosidase [Candidatus Thermoplasmatota archaeon]|nr:beta-galactosidase [Candidatus Thermoplasmatota archaeon]